MRPAAYLDTDCDLYSSAYESLDWAFASGVAQVGTVVGYDDWWVFACSHAKGRRGQEGNLSAAIDIFEHGEAKAHKEITYKYGVRFECLCGPCLAAQSPYTASPTPLTHCATPGWDDVPPKASCWRPLFAVRELR